MSKPVHGSMVMVGNFFTSGILYRTQILVVQSTIIYADLAAKLFCFLTTRRCIPPRWNDGSFRCCPNTASDGLISPDCFLRATTIGSDLLDTAELLDESDREPEIDGNFGIMEKTEVSSTGFLEAGVFSSGKTKGTKGI